MKYSRRLMIKYLGLLPFVRAVDLRSASLAGKQLNEDYVLVNGWILKRSDFVENAE